MGKEWDGALIHLLTVSRSSHLLLWCNSETQKHFLGRVFQATSRLTSPQSLECALKEAQLRHPIHKAVSALGTQAQGQSSVLKSSHLQFELGDEPSTLCWVSRTVCLQTGWTVVCSQWEKPDKTSCYHPDPREHQPWSVSGKCCTVTLLGLLCWFK